MKKTFKQIMLSSGERSDFGSEESINELEGAINFLKGVRDNLVAKNKQFRKERYTISRAIDSLRHVKRKAEKINSLKTIKKSLI